jgi:hypothetical protein
MSDTEKQRLAQYIADYIMEEQSRGNTTVDKFMVLDALQAFEGGAR